MDRNIHKRSTNSSNPVRLLRDAQIWFELGRKPMDQVKAYDEVKSKILNYVEAYKAIYEDGFQPIKDIAATVVVTSHVIEEIEKYVDLDGDIKHRMAVTIMMEVYDKYSNKLPWYIKMVPRSWIESVIGKAIDSLVKLYNDKKIFK